MANWCASWKRPTLPSSKRTAGNRPKCSSPKAATARPIFGASSPGRTDFDPSKKYPVIEYIYAGPHGSYVPKSFSAASRWSALNDLGFIVVQMDGMGTANRSKAFHDVCWHNLKDAGFPDRILWHQGGRQKISVLRHLARRHLRQLRRRSKRGRGRAVSSRVLQSGRRRLRLPRQPDGQSLVERTMDGLSRRPALCRVVEHRKRRESARQAAC